MDRLRNSLEDKGLSVDRVKVDVAPRLPEREPGLPPIHHPGAQEQASLGAGTADQGNNGSGHQGHGGGSAGPEVASGSITSGGTDGAEDPLAVNLAGMNYTLDASGRLRMDALA